MYYLPKLTGSQLIDYVVDVQLDYLIEQRSAEIQVELFGPSSDASVLDIDLLDSTALSSKPFYAYAPAEDTAFLPTSPGTEGSASVLGQISDHLQSLENGISVIYDGVTTANEIVGHVQTALGIFEKVEKAADKVADTMSTFSKVLKLVAQVPALKFVANSLSDVFKDLSAEVRKLEKKAGDIDKKLEDEKQLAEDVGDELDLYEDWLEQAGSDVGSMRQVVDTADAVYTLIAGGSTTYDYVSLLNIELSGAEAFYLQTDGLQDLMNTVDGKVDLVTGAYDGVMSFVNQARSFDAQISKIAGALDFLEPVLRVLNVALKPVEWALDIVGFIFDTIVAPILNPILDAIGVTAIFDSIKNKLLGLFPDINLIDDIDLGISDFFDFDINLAFDIGNPLDDFRNSLSVDFLDVIADVDILNDELILIEPAEPTRFGGDGDDIVSGNRFNNEIWGGNGADILIAGQGEDYLYGGADVGGSIVDDSLDDQAIFNANAGEFKIVQEDGSDVVTFIHVRPASPNRDMGTNYIQGVEFFVFYDVTITKADLENLTQMDPMDPTHTFNGSGNTKDFVFGSTENELIYGGAGDDYLNGNGGTDAIFGGDGNDILSGGGGNTDTLDGDGGFDTATFAGYANPVTVALLPQSLRNANPTLFIPTETHFLIEIEEVIGSSFGDTLIGDIGVNAFLGEDGNDILRGLWGDDALSGGNGNDFLTGDRGNDTLSGNAGDDYIAPGYGDNDVDGGEGEDSVYYGAYQGLPTELENYLLATNYLGGPTVAGLPTYIVYDGANDRVLKYNGADILLGTDTLTSVERVFGASGSNIFIGTDEFDGDMHGGIGSDIFRLNGNGDQGADYAWGYDGDDLFYLSYFGTEGAFGGNGDDTFIYEYEGELTKQYFASINGGGGYDIIDFTASAYAIGPSTSVFGFVGALGGATGTFMSIQQIEEFHATDYDDDLDLYNGHVTLLYLGEGNDRAIGSLNTSVNTIYGGDGDDDMTANGVADAFFYGGAGNDIFRGPGDYFELEPPDNTYDGGEGDDIFFGGVSREAFIGGNGIDRVVYTGLSEYTSSGVFVDMLDPNFANSDSPLAVGDTFFSIENLEGSENPDEMYATHEANDLIGNDGGDILYGRGGDDNIFGGEGFDDIYGGDGDDSIHGGTFPNYIDGGAGIDTVSFNFDGELYGAVTADLMDMVDHNAFVSALGGTNTGSSNTLVSIENLVGGQFGDDMRADNNDNSLTGAEGDDVLMSRGGVDTLSGGFGNDVLDGGAGDDFLIGGEDDDLIFGGLGIDTASYESNALAVTVNLTTGLLSEAYLVAVQRWADTLTSELRMSVLSGDMVSPSDVLESDPLFANDADDYDFNYNIDQDNGVVALINMIEYDGLDALSPVLNDFNITEVEIEGFANDILSGIENFKGGLGDDDITGSGADNVLEGGGGNDAVRGGGGEDTLYGGDGDDALFGDSTGGAFEHGLAMINVGGQDKLPNTPTNSTNPADYNGPVNEYLQAENLTTLGGSELTFEFLYQAQEQVTRGNYFMSYAAGSSANEILFEESYGSNLLNILVNGVTFNTGISGDILTDGLMHRVSLSYQHIAFAGSNDRGIVTLYIDGTEIYSAFQDNANMAAIEAGGRLIFGQEQDSSGVDPLFDVRQIGSGAFGDIRIFNDLRTEAEINANLFTHADDTDTNLVENWTFDNGIGNRTGSSVMTLNGGALQSAAGAGDDLIYGDAGNDNIYAAGGNDTAYGGADDDYIHGGAGDDLLFGDDGNDVLVGSLGADTLTGGAGSDTMDYSASGAALIANLVTQTVSGGQADGDIISDIESVIGTAFVDTITGNGSANTIEGGAGGDLLSGAGGLDIISYAGSNAAVDINLVSQIVSGGHANGDVISGFEGAIGSAFNDNVRGAEGVSRIYGLGGNDKILGGSGADSLYGGDGADIINGQNDNDMMFGDAGDDQMTGGLGDDSMFGGADDDFINGQGGHDMLFGDAGHDDLFGASGDDVLDGGDGHDSLAGGGGNDELSGGAGNDTLNGGIGLDLIYGGAGADEILGGNQDDELHGDGGGDNIRGNLGNDLIYGGAANDTLDGESGADEIYGGTGNDVISGGSSGDMLFGDAGADTLSGGSGNDTLYGGEDDDDLAGGGGADALYGDAGNDMLSGAGGGDDLFGGAGDDVLQGGGGNDDLTGGLGADIFDMDLGFGIDRIKDYEDGSDLIDFSGNSLANSFAAVLSKASQVGVNVRIELNANNTLILEATDLADLDASDFIF